VKQTIQPEGFPVTLLASARRAETAYGAAASPTRTDRDGEYAVLSRVTRRLKAAADLGAAGFPELAAALHENRKLWTALAADLGGDGNGLSRDLRAQLLSLALFTDRHTSKVLAREGDPSPLIEINAAIMRGLLARPPEAPARAPARFLDRSAP
jgi:flagellar protein FlaF